MWTIGGPLKKWKFFFNTASGLVNVNFAKKAAMTPLVAPSGENSEDETQKRTGEVDALYWLPNERSHHW